jgi:hypothetical protein
MVDGTPRLNLNALRLDAFQAQRQHSSTCWNIVCPATADAEKNAA